MEVIVPGTHLLLREVKHVSVKCITLERQHRSNVQTLNGEKHYGIYIGIFNNNSLFLA